MQMNKTKFERNSTLEYYRMTCIGKTKHTSTCNICAVNQTQDAGVFFHSTKNIETIFCDKTLLRSSSDKSSL